MVHVRQDGVALITGAGNGMGRSHIIGLAHAGFRVVGADVDGAAVQAVVQELKEAGTEALGLTVDVTNEAAVAEMVAAARAYFGRVDVLVNNAGGAPTTAGLLETTLADWEATLRLNLTSQFLCIRALLPSMIAQGGGRIINIASASVFNGATAALYQPDSTTNLVAYVAAKGGVVGLTRTLAREVGRWKIAVNAVAPGFTPTERVRQIYPAEAMDRVVGGQAFGRLQTPEDATGAVVFLASPAAEFITGQVICVDGGWTMG